MIPRTLLAATLIGLATTTVAAPPHADGDFILLDIDRDGSLSRDEAAWQPLVSADFDKLDLNKDGALSRPEFAAFEVTSGRGPRAAHQPQTDDEAAAAVKTLKK